MASRVDWAILEREFVAGTMSLREVARRNGLSNGYVSAYARDHEWAMKRNAYQSAVARQSYESMAEAAGHNEAQVRSESVAVLLATLRRYAEQLINGTVVVTTKDAILSIDMLTQLLRPLGASSEEETIINVTTGQPDADFLRRVIEAARRGQAAATSEPASPGLGAVPTRQN